MQARISLLSFSHFTQTDASGHNRPLNQHQAGFFNICLERSQEFGAQRAIDGITRADGDATKLSLLLNWCRSKARNEHTSTADTSKEETKS